MPFLSAEAPMKSILLTPTFLPKLTGNAVTVARITGHLEGGGITCRIIDLSVTHDGEKLSQALSFQPDIIHNFHAYKAGRTGLKLKKVLGVPMITTMTGTDLYVDLKENTRRGVILDVLRHSEWVTVFNEQARSLLCEKGIRQEGINVIHQSVQLPEGSTFDFRKYLQIEQTATVFLLLGSIRRVKDPGLAPGILEEARKHFPGIHLIIAGSVLEEREFHRMRAWMEKPWVTCLGEVPRAHIRALFMSVDVVLNTSLSESESNSVLEAMSCRRIVLGRDIPGNASILTDETGFMFRNKKEFLDQIIYIMENPDKLEAKRQKAGQLIKNGFTAEREQADYLALYRKYKSGPRL
jgi:glycosyltransferase involved in cell wall biosynthesis